MIDINFFNKIDNIASIIETITFLLALFDFYKCIEEEKKNDS